MANVHSEITKITPAVMITLGHHPLAWKPEDFSNTNDPPSTPEYVTFVDKDGVAEVEKALETFKSEGSKWNHVDQLANLDRPWA
jgi:hypothetical protein